MSCSRVGAKPYTVATADSSALGNYLSAVDTIVNVVLSDVPRDSSNDGNGDARSNKPVLDCGRASLVVSKTQNDPGHTVLLVRLLPGFRGNVRTSCFVPLNPRVVICRN